MTTVLHTSVSPIQIDPKRLQKARALLSSGAVTRVDQSTWQVASQTGSGWHLVNLDGPKGEVSSLRCSCPDWNSRNFVQVNLDGPEVGLGAPCKHCLSVCLAENWLEDNPPPPSAPQALFAEEPDEEDEFGEFAVEFEEITDRLQADSLLWQIGQLEEEIAEIDSLAEKEVAQIERWRVRERSKLEERVTAFSGGLQAFLRKEGRKSLSLPHGKLQFRKNPDRVSIDEQLFDWEREEFIRVVPEQKKPNLSAIKKHLKQTGEIIEGAQLQWGEEQFSAIPDKSKVEERAIEKKAA
jgi:hypothetical protein